MQKQHDNQTLGGHDYLLPLLHTLFRALMLETVHLQAGEERVKHISRWWPASKDPLGCTAVIRDHWPNGISEESNKARFLRRAGGGVRKHGPDHQIETCAVTPSKRWVRRLNRFVTSADLWPVEWDRTGVLLKGYFTPKLTFYHPKYLKLCSKDEWSFYGFGLT